MKKLTRRVFLKVSGATGVGVAVGCGLQCGSDPPPDLDPEIGCFDVGAPQDYRVGELRYFEEAPLIVGRDDDGLYAMSGKCTHIGNHIGDDPAEILPEGNIVCSHRNTEFTRTGVYVEGPANGDLQHYELTIEDGRLVCCTSVPVERSTRLPPPA